MNGWEYTLYAVLVWGTIALGVLSAILLVALVVQGYCKLKRECRDH